MNVLQVLPELNAGGVERTTIEIADALIRDGHTAHVASQGGRMQDQLSAMGALHHAAPLKSKSPLKLRTNTKFLIDLIKAEKIDIIHARSRAPAWAAAAAAKACDIPFITTYHGIYNAKSRLKRRYNAVMTKGDVVIANSNFTNDHIIAEHGTDPSRLVVIPRGVDMALFDPKTVSTADINTCRKNWGVNTDNPVLLLPGRLTRWKGQLLAITALADLHKNGQICHLVLLGDAQGREHYVEEIKAHAKTCGVENHVIIAEHSNDMPTAFASADCVISASTDPEAFGRVSAEAQAMGAFIIASAHGGSLETVEHGAGGLLFTPSDADNLSQALQSALSLLSTETRAARTKRQKQARARIQGNFSAHALQQATLAVYRSVYAPK